MDSAQNKKHLYQSSVCSSHVSYLVLSIYFCKRNFFCCSRHLTCWFYLQFWIFEMNVCTIKKQTTYNTVHKILKVSLFSIKLIFDPLSITIVHVSVIKINIWVCLSVCQFPQCYTPGHLNLWDWPRGCVHWSPVVCIKCPICSLVSWSIVFD